MVCPDDGGSRLFKKVCNILPNHKETRCETLKCSGASNILIKDLYFLYLNSEIFESLGIQWGPRLRSWLIPCATNRKVAGSISDGVIGILH